MRPKRRLWIATLLAVAGLVVIWVNGASWYRDDGASDPSAVIPNATAADPMATFPLAAQQMTKSTEDAADGAAAQVNMALDGDHESVEFQVLALNHQEDGFAVIDLADSVMRLYRFGHHGIHFDAVDVAAFTEAGDILVHVAGDSDLYLVPGGSFAAAPLSIPLPRSPQPNVEPADNVEALGDRFGENIWLLQRTGDSTLIDLVTKEGAALASFELNGDYFINGLADNDLIVHGGSKRGNSLLRTTGTVENVVLCPTHIMEEEYLRVVYVRGSFTACLSEDDKELILYDAANGHYNRLTAPASGHWSQPVLPDIPAVNTRGTYGNELLLTYHKPDPTNSSYTTVKTIYAANPSEHTIRAVHHNEGNVFLLLLGMVDNLLIVAKGTTGQGEIIMSIDIRTGDERKIIELPEGYFIYDVR